jgi:hypothetical protein
VCIFFLGFLSAKDQWVPYISLVFREMWEMRTLMFFASGVEKLAGGAKWYPTSRETRARCGAPMPIGTKRSPNKTRFILPRVGNAGG